MSDVDIRPQGRGSWLVEVEALRAVAFVFIVFGHAVGVMAAIEHGWRSMALFGSVLALTRFSLLAFMAMTSLLIARRAVDGRPSSSFRAAGRLLWPYTLLTVGYLLLTRAIIGGQAAMAPQLLGDVVRAWFTGSGFYHLWYVVVALQIVLVAPFAAAVLKAAPIRIQLVALLLATTGTMVLVGQVGGPITRALPFTSVVFGPAADRVVFFWTAYVVLGVVIGLNFDAAMGLLRRYRGIVLSLYLICCVTLVALVVRQSALVGGDYRAVADISRVLQAWVVPFQMLSIVAWLDIAGLLARGRFGSLTSALAAVSFGGYLIHPFWLMVGSQWVSANNAQPNPLLTVLFLWAFTLGASYLSVVLVARVRVPFGEAVLGAVPAPVAARETNEM